MGYKLCHQIPDARLQVVSKSMHSLPVERPRVCSQQIRWFLKQNGQQWSKAPRVSTLDYVAETIAAER